MSLKIRKETTASGLTYAHVEVFGQITAEIANEIMAATHQGGAFSGLPRLYLSDQNTELPSEAREIFTRKYPGEINPPSAIVISNAVQRVMMNFVMRVSSTTHIRLFSDRVAALSWLEETAGGKAP